MMRKFAMADAWSAEEAKGVGKVAPGSHTSAFVIDKSLEGGLTRGLPGGHSTLEDGMVFESSFATPSASKAYMDRVVELYGKENAPSILFNRHLLIFPNLALMDHLIRVLASARNRPDGDLILSASEPRVGSQPQRCPSPRRADELFSSRRGGSGRRRNLCGNSNRLAVEPVCKILSEPGH